MSSVPGWSGFGRIGRVEKIRRLCLEDGRKLHLNWVFEIERNVGSDLLSASNIARPIYFSDGAICAR